MLGYFFRSALGPQPNISTLSILVFLLQQRFAFTLHVRYYCVIRAYSSDFNLSSYLQLWIGSVHQSYTAGVSLGEELIGLSSLGAGDFILCDIVHQLKLLQLCLFDDRSPIMARINAIYRNHMATQLITLPATDKKYLMDSFPRGALLFNFIMLHDRVVITHQYLCFGSKESSPKAMIISCPRHISRFKLEFNVF